MCRKSKGRQKDCQVQKQISDDDAGRKEHLKRVEERKSSKAVRGLTEAERAYRERPPAAASVPSCHLPDHLPSDHPAGDLPRVLLPPHQVNLLLPGRQTTARNAVRLSLFVVAPYLGSYLFSQIPHYGSPALHGVKEKAILFLNPIKLSGSYSLFTKADPLLTVHRPRGRLAKRRSESLQSCWCLDLGGTVFFFRLL